MATGLDFRILGSLEVRLHGRPLNLGGARQRGVLALLLLHANEVVSSGALIEGLWADDPPADTSAALQAHVSRLRKLLEPDHGGDPRVIVTTPSGYLIRAGSEAFDLLRFEALVAEGRRRLDHDAAAAGEVLRKALALWRGRPLADLASEPFARAAILELDELWLEAAEARIDADLETGRHVELVRELTALVHRHPLRERLHAQLMLALYRSGRQAEALETYAALHRTLVDELGLEPTREVRELQEAILRQDPALERERERPAHQPRRRRAAIGALAAGVGAAAVLAGFALLRSDDSKPARANPSPSGEGVLVVMSPRSGEVRARVAVGATPSAVAVGQGGVWVLNADDQTLSRIDPRSRRADTFAIGATPTDVAAGADGVWVGRGGRVAGAQASGLVATALARLDPQTRSPRATIALPRGRASVSDAIADHIAVGRDAVWTVGPDGRVLRVDPRTNRVAATIRGANARAIAADGDSIWALAGDGRVARIDARSNAVVGRGKVSASAVASIAAGQGGAWVSAPADGTLWRVDRGPGDRLVMHTLPVATGTTDLAYGAGALWAVNPLRGTLTQLDADRVIRTIPVGGFPRAVAVGEGAVWVAAAPAAPAAQPAAATATGVTPVSAGFCEPPFFGGHEPAQRLIVSDLPLQGGLRLSSQQMADAMAFVLREHGFRAGGWRVAYQSCDDAVAATRLPDRTKCATNARAYGRAADVLAVVGPLNSDCALAAVPELGRAADPLAIVSPLSSYVGLTRAAPGAPPGQLASLYPSGRRNFLRVVGADDHQTAALALLAKRLRRTPVYVLDDGDDQYGGLLAAQFERAARAVGLPVAGRATWTPGAATRRLAERVARARPGAVFLGGRLDTGGPAVVRALRERLGDRVAILAPEGFTPIPVLVDEAGAGARGVFVSLPGISDVRQLGPEGARFAERFGGTLAGQPVEPSAVYAAQAMEVVLDAVARSTGTRASVLDRLFETRIPNGLIGNVSFDSDGDVETSPVTILRAGRSRDAVYRRMQVPVTLLR